MYTFLKANLHKYSRKNFLRVFRTFSVSLVKYFWRCSEVKMIPDNSMKGLKMDSKMKAEIYYKN